MKKENIAVLAQILETIRDNINELEKAQKKGDSERVLSVKKEIMKFQKKAEELL